MPKANGEGSIYPRIRNGRQSGYAGAIGYTDEHGQMKRRAVYGRTRVEVRDKLNEIRKRLDDCSAVRDSRCSVADWMARWRTTTLAVSDRKESTKELYSNLSRRHVESEPFGAIRLDKLRPSDVEALILAMRSKAKPGKGTATDSDPEPVRALADSTIRQVYTILRAGLDAAVRDGLLAKNPAASIARPGVARKEARHHDVVDLRKLLLCAEGLRYHNVLALIASTGMRRGEAVALHWADIDLEKREARIRGTLGRVGGRLTITEPKTDRSRRSIPLSAQLVASLRSHRENQQAERLAARDQWREHDLVFATEFGKPVDPRNILRTVQIAAEKAGLTNTSVHALRHSAGTAWLEARVPIDAVADLLGHSSIAITGDIYGHSSGQTARAAVDQLSDDLGMLDF
jgi:integrase